MKRCVYVELDETAHELLLQVKRAIVAKNDERTRSGLFDGYERATVKAIIQRGVASVAREYNLQHVDGVI